MVENIKRENPVELNNEEVIEILKKKLRNDFAVNFFINKVLLGRYIGEKAVTGIYRKGKNTFEIVNKIIEDGFTPIVDDYSGLILAVNPHKHEIILEALNQIYISVEKVTYEAEDYFLKSGKGYYMSSALKGTFLINRSYRIKPEDRVVFNFYSTIQI